MVGHENVGVNLATVAPGSITEPFLGQIVGRGKKARLTVVAALHNVQRHAIKVNTGVTGHGAMLAL